MFHEVICLTQSVSDQISQVQRAVPGGTAHQDQTFGGDPVARTTTRGAGELLRHL